MSPTGLSWLTPFVSAVSVNSAEALEAISWVAPLVNTALTLVAGTFVLARYHWNRLRQSVFWGVALIFLGLTNFMEFGYNASIVAATPISFILGNSFLSTSIVLLYCGCALFFTRRRLYTIFLPSLFLVEQEINMVYLYVIAGYQFPIVTINIIFFGIPIALFAGSSFLLDYLSSRRKASLVISIASWMYGGLGLLTFSTSLTPYAVVFHLLSAVTIVVLFLGFIMLVSPKSKNASR